MAETHPFKCNRCTKSYTRKFSLVNHQRIHSGERPFRCGEQSCGKTFTSQDLRRTHEATHASAKNYACSVCAKAFSRSSILRKHEETVHRCTSRPSAVKKSSSKFNWTDVALREKRNFAVNGVELFERSQGAVMLEWQLLMGGSISSPYILGGLRHSSHSEDTLPEPSTETTWAIMRGTQWMQVMEKETYSPLFYARAWFIAAHEGNADALLYLHARVGVALGLTLDTDTAAHIVAQKGHHTALLKLIALGADMMVKCLFGRTPLLTAICYEQKPCVMTLLEVSRDFDLQKPEYCTSIWRCALEHHVEIFRAVLSRTKGNINQEFVHYGVDGTLLVHLAAKKQNLTYLSIALEFGADIYARNSLGQTALHAASAHCSASCMSFLLERDSQLGTYRDKSGQTALHVIGDKARGYRQNQLQCLECLLVYSDINARDHRGNTPLLAKLNVMCQEDFSWHWLWSIFEEILFGMLRYGANVNVINKDGQSPFDLAYRAYEAALCSCYEMVACRGDDPDPDVTEREQEKYARLHAGDLGNLNTANKLLSMLAERGAHTGKAIARYFEVEPEDEDSDETRSTSVA